MSFRHHFRAKPAALSKYQTGQLRARKRASVIRWLVVVSGAGIATGVAIVVFTPNDFSKTAGAVRAIAANAGIVRANEPPPGAYYTDCNDARASGVSPLYRGESGYRLDLDRDEDGVACEPIPKST